MTKNIVIFYIEGSSNPRPKQEKHFFQIPTSARLWSKYFENAGFNFGKFIIVPKYYAQPATFKKFLKIIDSDVSTMYNNRSYTTKKTDQVEVRKIITGDYDLVKNPKELKVIFEIAQKLKNKYLDATIVLVKDKYFKIESIMSEFAGEKLNKSILKSKYSTEFPTVKDIVDQVEGGFEKILLRLDDSNHPLFKEIKKLAKR